MPQIIKISEEIFSALEYEASQNELTTDALAELWLKQRLDLEKYPELEWRQGPSGWRVGIKGLKLTLR